MENTLKITQDIALQTPFNEKIHIKLKNAKFGTAPNGEETYFIYFTLDYYALQELCTNELMNLQSQILNEFLFEKLETGIEVEIEASLKKIYTNFMSEQFVLPKDFFKLFELRDSKYEFLFKTESWLPLVITQKMVLPEEMQEMGSVKLGYKTLWHSSRNENQQANMHDIVQFFFLENKWNFENIKDNIYRIKCKGDNTKWIGLVRVDEEKKFCLFYSIVPELVPEHKREEMAKFLIHLNYDIGIGNFEMDMEDGEVRFRTSIDVEGDRLSKALFQQLLSMNMGTMNKYIGEILEKIR